MSRLVLWDIDGTLLQAGPVGREVLLDGVAAALGRPVDGHEHPMGGKTDPQIVRELFEMAGVAPTELDPRLAAAIEHTERALGLATLRMRTEGQVLPGVRELLGRLVGAPGVVSGVLTGNTRTNAAAKLAAFDLDELLDLDAGAFGSDHHDRLELVPLAVARAQQRHGMRLHRHEVWVVGDTPRDHACGAAAGVRTLLVATGPHSLDELAGCGADAVLPDLSDTDAVLRLLLAA